MLSLFILTEPYQAYIMQPKLNRT